MTDARADVIRMFREFAVTTRHDSPLYSALSEAAAGADDVVDLLVSVDDRQRRPVLLFAAVHDLVLRGVEHDLATYYPSVGGNRPPSREAGAALVDFCREFAGALVELLASMATQTNEVNRCAGLLPAIVAGTQGVTVPLHLVEIGASAGLNLLLDRYRYRYDIGGRVEVAGPVASAVECSADVRGGRPLPDLSSFGVVGGRGGVDLSPVDVMREDGARWLVACTWSDQTARIERLRAAVRIARTEPPRVERGDAVDAVTSRVAGVPDGHHPVVFHSWVLAYLAADRQREFEQAVSGVGRRRDLTWVIVEQPDEVPGLPVPTGEQLATAVVVVTWRGGKQQIVRVADMHPHGRWVHWLA